MPVGAEQVKSEIAAVAVRHGRENVFAVMRSLEHNLGNSREVFADRIRVLSIGRPELMKINLLIKIQVGVRPFTFARKACVINAGAIRIPRGAPTGGRKLHMGDCVR